MGNDELEKVMKETTINFARPLDFRGVNKMLKYVGDNLPGTVSFQASYNRSVGEGLDGKIGSMKFGGMISDYSKSRAFDSFEISGCPEVTSMNFFMVPGWDLEEYRVEVRELWTSVRGTIEKYFEEEN